MFSPPLKNPVVLEERMAGSHVPTAAQLAKLATLQATLTSANTTLTSAQATLATAQAAQLAAAKAWHDYQHYIYGGTLKPGVLDEGSRDAA